MRLVLLTTLERGIASRVLPALCASPDLTVAAVVLAGAGSLHAWRDVRRRLLKTVRIGVPGALNGVRLRAWYADPEAEDLRSLCHALHVPLATTPCVNCDRTRTLFRDARADLGLSLGNGYIAKGVFAIPRHGMINIHTELLPDFRGGVHGVLWPIHERKSTTGFTIHQIDSHMDTGDILYREALPIRFYPTLRETVERNTREVRLRVPRAFATVCEQYPALKARSTPQGAGGTYTTPTIRQFLRMVLNHRAMYRDSLAEGRTGR